MQEDASFVHSYCHNSLSFWNEVGSTA